MGRYKILFIAWRYPSKENPVSGIFLREHAKAISLYNDIVVLTREDIDSSIRRGYYRIDDSIEKGLRTLRLRYRKSPIPKTTYLIYLWGMFGAFRKLLREGYKPDIIHANVYTAGVSAVLLGKLYKIPVIISEHFSSFPRRMLKGVEALKARFAMNRADLIMPVSKDLIKHIRAYGIQNDFEVVPNAVDTEIFHPDTDKKNHTIKRILLVALLNPVKGVPYLLDAIAILSKKRNDFVLDIVGDGPYREEYEKSTYKLGIENKVNFHGLMSKEQVAQFMRESDFFVLPSESETFGVVLIESLASGIPVIATDSGGSREIINEDVGMLVKSKDSNALAESIDYMLEHYCNYSLKTIVQYVKGQYSSEAVGKQINEIYKRLIKII
ncbi:glycosyltransferase [candidate division WOR-3 bacterium]|nr:glycosyltransferase [candidate division WOR-3 bacterium]